MPKISMIIPVYNVEKYLRECLDSVLNSTLEDIEVIVIDDGGKDGCPEIIDLYAKKDSRIVPIHKENGGYGQTCNLGIDLAKGEYIAIVEPDDYIDKNMYSDLYNIAVRNDASVVKSKYIENYDLQMCSFQKVMPNQGFCPPEGVFTINDFPEFLSIHPSIWSCIYKKDFLDKNKIRFLEIPGAGWSDNLFQVQTLCLADRIVFTDKAYYYWRKLFLDDSLALKDFTIPINRTLEIHNWLNSQNIDNIKISTFLLKRELSYLKTIHKIIKFSQISEYKSLLEKYFAIPDVERAANQPEITEKERKFYNLLKKRTESVIIKDKIKFFVSNIIKFRFGKNSKYLYIFGICILRR